MHNCKVPPSLFQKCHHKILFILRSEAEQFCCRNFFFFFGFCAYIHENMGSELLRPPQQSMPKRLYLRSTGPKTEEQGGNRILFGVVGTPPQNIFVIISEIFLFFLTTNLSEYRGLKIKKGIFFFFILLNSIFFFSVNTVKIKLLKKSKIFYRTIIFAGGS